MSQKLLIMQNLIYLQKSQTPVQITVTIVASEHQVEIIVKKAEASFQVSFQVSFQEVIQLFRNEKQELVVEFQTNGLNLVVWTKFSI